MNTENNKLIEELKLIAVYDGWELSPYPNLPDKVYKDNGEIGVQAYQLNYHEDWNLLMPIVDKISMHVIKGNPSYNSDQFVRVEIVPSGYVKITDLRDTPIFANVAMCGSLIAAVYKAVVEFITWHNTQPK